jgi:hypothetical protein
MASSIIELSLAPVADEVMNVTNPTLIHWTHDLLPQLREAGLEVEQGSAGVIIIILRSEEL